MQAPAIRISNVWTSFPGKNGGEPIHVLEKINTEVAPGEFVCIVGPSGCGKSTLLNMVGGFLPVGQGEITVEGEPVRRPDPRRIFVFQENGVFPWLTVRENIGFGLRKQTAGERTRIVGHYTEMVGMTGFEGSVSTRAFGRDAPAGGDRPRARGQS